MYIHKFSSIPDGTAQPQLVPSSQFPFHLARQTNQTKWRSVRIMQKYDWEIALFHTKYLQLVFRFCHEWHAVGPSTTWYNTNSRVQIKYLYTATLTSHMMPFCQAQPSPSSSFSWLAELALFWLPAQNSSDSSSKAQRSIRLPNPQT